MSRHFLSQPVDQRVIRALWVDSKSPSKSRPVVRRWSGATHALGLGALGIDQSLPTLNTQQIFPI